MLLKLSTEQGVGGYGLVMVHYCSSHLLFGHYYGQPDSSKRKRPHCHGHCGKFPVLDLRAGCPEPGTGSCCGNSTARFTIAVLALNRILFVSFPVGKVTMHLSSYCIYVDVCCRIICSLSRFSKACCSPFQPLAEGTSLCGEDTRHAFVKLRFGEIATGTALAPYRAIHSKSFDLRDEPLFGCSVRVT